MQLSLAVITLVISVSLAEKIRFDDYRLYRLIPNDEETLNILKQWEEADQPSDFNFWSPVVKLGGPVDLLVPPHRVGDIDNMVKSKRMNATVLMENLQQHIDNEGLRLESRAGGFDWTSYHTFEEYNDFLASVASSYPDVVTLIKGGASYEGRDILGVRISFSSANENNAVFLESLIHAREWIGGAVSTYILNEILTSTDPTFRTFAESYDWYIFPVVNPDGFVYTHTTNRLWRKTRVPYDDLCFGADPNRNWDYYWNTGGSDSSPCSETYSGPSAFSEPSTLSLSQYISTISDKLVAYISFHSYSQLLLIPYGYTADHLDNYDVTYPIGLKAAESLAKRYGTKYTVGCIVDVIYVASGGSIDWVKGTFGTPLVYAYELRDTGTYGFVLPAEQIIPTALETLDSLVTMLQEYEKTKASS